MLTETITETEHAKPLTFQFILSFFTSITNNLFIIPLVKTIRLIMY